MDYFFIHNIPVCIDSSSTVNLVVNYSRLDFNSIIKNINDSNKVHISWNKNKTILPQLLMFLLLLLKRNNFIHNSSSATNTVNFGLRSVTPHRNMRWGDVTIKVDSNGQQYLEYNERQTKTRTGENTRNVSLLTIPPPPPHHPPPPPPKAWATNDERCPVKLLGNIWYRSYPITMFLQTKLSKSVAIATCRVSTAIHKFQKHTIVKSALWSRVLNDPSLRHKNSSLRHWKLDRNFWIQYFLHQFMQAQ